ncbi:MAG: hypothetical protein D6806_14235 [Deltaproteobacteria bacterium]|nr:MAG: hypothetical protein D6806_14235 [Deltaproteobacteria bacterium]
MVKEQLQPEIAPKETRKEEKEEEMTDLSRGSFLKGGTSQSSGSKDVRIRALCQSNGAEIANYDFTVCAHPQLRSSPTEVLCPGAAHHRRRWASRLRQDEPEDLYEIIRLRYEKGSMVITSNRAVEEWPPLFGDALMASSMPEPVMGWHLAVSGSGNWPRSPLTGRPWNNWRFSAVRSWLHCRWCWSSCWP